MSFQTDFFALTDIDEVNLKLESACNKYDKMCRGLFARHNELSQLYIEQQKEIDALKELLKF
jgi:hypothetical protein